MSKITRFALFLAVGVVLVGCQSNKDAEAWQDPFFPPDRVTPPSKVMFNRQLANGAAADGMLFDVHFDGSELNSLGEQKITTMVQGAPAHSPLQVYLNMPKDDASSAARQTTVEKALANAGLPKEKFTVAFGPNPKVLMPAEAGIRALSPVGAGAGTSTESGGAKVNSAKAE